MTPGAAFGCRSRLTRGRNLEPGHDRLFRVPCGDAGRAVARAPSASRGSRDDHGEHAAVVSASGRRRLEDLVRPFGGLVHCHVPMDRPFSYAALARPDDGRDRWGASGTRTVYLAGDPAVALAEYARHRDVGAPAERRCLCSFRLQAVSVLDLRAGEAIRILGPSSAAAFLDRQEARRVSRAVRETGVCQGLIVPSMAYLDRPERLNVVLFVERLGADLESLLTDRETVGEIRVSG
jgi:RES domain-containing protein